MAPRSSSTAEAEHKRRDRERIGVRIEHSVTQNGWSRRVAND
jgi:hypothetical protein